MPRLTFSVNAGPFRKAVRSMARATRPQSFKRELRETARDVLSVAILSPIPFDEGKLARSAAVVDSDRPGEVLFGFNTVYAAFQDSSYFKGSERVVRPKPPKKFLYIPTSKRGKRHVLGANPEDEGLERNVDYILRKEAHIPIKPYGSPEGPNAYFAGTIDRVREETVISLGRRVARRIGALKAVGAVTVGGP